MAETSLKLPTIATIIATVGRESAMRAIKSVLTQQIEGDQLIVITDDPPHNDWGAWARNEGMRQATADFIAFIDDDDMYAPGAFAAMRAALSKQPDHVHIFRMQICGPMTNDIVWTEQDLSKPGQVGTPMIVVPNDQSKLGRFTNRYQCDYDFAVETIANFDGRVAWHEHVTSLVWPSRIGTDDPEHSVVMDRSDRIMKWS